MILLVECPQGNRENVSVALRALNQEYHEGDLTEKGYMKKQAILLEPFKNLVSTNGTVSFRTKQTEDKIDSLDDSRVGQGPVGGARKLLSLTGVDGEEVEYQVAEVVAVAKLKELNRERDLRKAVEEWEKMYGPWVRAG